MSEIGDIASSLDEINSEARQYGQEALGAVSEDSPFETLVEWYQEVGQAAIRLVRATNALEIHYVRTTQALLGQYGTDGEAITAIKERLSAVTQGSNNEHLAGAGDHLSKLPDGFMQVMRRLAIIHEQLNLTDVRIWMTEFAEQAADVGPQVSASIEENKYVTNTNLQGLQTNINAWKAGY